jgi:hypothetical protein
VCGSLIYSNGDTVACAVASYTVVAIL